MTEKTHSQEFSVDGVPTVRIGNIRGSVTVSPGPDGLVSITAVERGSNERTRVEIGQEDDGTIYARTKDRKFELPLALLGNRPNKVHYTILAPAHTDLKVRCVSADTEVRGLTGDIRLKSVSGELRTEDLSGELELETVSGRITGSRLIGPAKLRTVSGGVRLTGSELPALDADSVSGSMDLETPVGAGPYKIGTVSGNVRLRTGDHPSGRIHFRSVSGSASVDSDRLKSSEKVSHPGPRNALYELSKDGPDIHFHSVSGSLRLVTDGGDPAEPAAPAPAHPGRMEILEKIASGEISVDEAVEVMRG